MTCHRNYRVGIDVGTNSIGFAAIEIDADGMPTNALNLMVLIHDSGVDPSKQKTAITRLATAGVARRTRNLIQRRRKRLNQLDTFITSLDWPIIDPQEFSDPYYPWHARANLATKPLEGDEQKRALSIAIRHIARHRGWRSPYASIESLLVKTPDSDEFSALKQRVTERSGVVFDASATPAQVVCDSGLDPNIRLRSAPGNKYGPRAVIDGVPAEGKAKEGIIGGKLRQSDNANEIRRIGEVQGLSPELVNTIIRKVFAAETPKGKAALRAGKDDLPGQQRLTRAPKALLKFQEFRIVSTLANIRVHEGGQTRTLTHDEREKARLFLLTSNSTDLVTWSDVASEIGIDRNSLVGTASKAGVDERASANPPINQTSKKILASKIKPLTKWWNDHVDEDDRQALVTALSNAEELGENEPGAEAARQFLTSLDDETLAKLDSLKLPAGRAAYSPVSLSRLIDRMRSEDLDLYEARRAEFGVPRDWEPEAEPIGAPVGNPAVDRVLKGVNRWLMAATRKWGAPESINIEHVRSALGSEAQVREYEKELGRRNLRTKQAVQEIASAFGINPESIYRSDYNRVLALSRQNCKCAYCGDPIAWTTSEMDHIVPRKGEGSTNKRSNLVAICHRCNHAKSNTPFAVWAEHCGITGVSLDEAVSRVREWNDDPALDKSANTNFKQDIISRLRKTTEDEAIDNRSIESVAWMAVELRHRIERHFANLGTDTKVQVFQGAITAEARRASGFGGSLNFIDGHKKTRLDRRHHAMDAATIALMRPAVAQSLAERSNLRQAQRISGQNQTWKDYWGTTQEQKYLSGVWRNHMKRLAFLFNDALAKDSIPVTQNLRLRLGSGEAHDATIRPLQKKHVGDSWSVTDIDRAESPQLWYALTRHQDFDSQVGLPEDPAREIRVKGEWLDAQSEIGIFKTPSAAIAVRGGYADLGNTIHHARIYKIPGKRPQFGMIRVFSSDLIRSQHLDLFKIELQPGSISMRTAEAKTRTAVLNGEAEYLGWLVTGDELLLNVSDPSFLKGDIGDILADFPDTVRWTVEGFPEIGRMRLRPTQLAGEGLKHMPQARKGTVEILNKGGWRVATNVLFTKASPRVLRRGTLGEVRTQRANNLPRSMSFE